MRMNFRFGAEIKSDGMEEVDLRRDLNSSVTGRGQNGKYCR